MVNLARRIWNFLCNLDLAVILLLAVSLNLLVGYFYFNAYPSVFRPLTYMMLPEWMRSLALANLAITWWFFTFLFFMIALGVNSFVCTTDKIAKIITNYACYPNGLRFMIRLSPHLIHYAVLIILVGHLTLVTVGMNYQHNILRLDSQVSLPGSPYHLQLQKLEVRYYDKNAMISYQGRAIDATADITVADGNGQTEIIRLRFNRPCWYEGYALHLDEFLPTSRESKRQEPYVELTVRTGPGIKIFLAGILLFIIGITFYLLQFTRIRKTREQTI
ncbi:MAG: cytochrome c biogenesis protein ResB [Desulfobacca sp.]|nr:cytochrome c biogenesis protein ResB [Desulfobacca sp.]